MKSEAPQEATQQGPGTGEHVDCGHRFGQRAGVVTKDRNEFSRVSGLQVESFWPDPAVKIRADALVRSGSNLLLLT